MSIANIRVVVSGVPNEQTANELAEELRQRFEYVFVELIGSREPDPEPEPEPMGGWEPRS